MSVAHLDTASVCAEEWVAQWAEVNDSTIERGPDCAPFTKELIDRVRSRVWIIDDPAPGPVLPEPPRGAEFVYFRGPVRRGFAMKLGDVFWLGFSEAGNGTRTLAWPVTRTDYENLVAALQEARRD